MISLLLFGSFLILLLVSVPIAISLGLASTIALLFSGKVSSSYIAQGLVTSIDSFPLMAVPFFILAGDLMGEGGLSRRLLNVADVFFGRYTGGLAVIGVVTSMFFAAISGSGPATVAAIGGLLLPAMARAGYEKGYSVGVLASAGSLGIIIPPSIPMIIYAVSANVSITEMFLAGAVPGLLIGLGLILTAYIKARKAGYTGDETRYTAKEKLSTVWEAKWALLVPVIILGGIYGGVFTPTEAAAVGVIYGFIVGVFFHKEIKLKSLYDVIAKSALTSATVIIIVGTATIFGRMLAIERIPFMIAEHIVSLTDNPILILVLINVLLLFVGMFMETLAAIIILVPILLPVVIAVGIDPVHFGIVMILNLAIGMVTPPVGVNLFVGARVGGTSLEKASGGAIPFILAMFAVLALVTYVPWISLALVNLMGG
ncbi:TRAP transporter large permease [Vreelandella titanicae]|uniref:TRAP transporter large permease n=1 Tax=Vreelandella titanicae TaxID=664683 RepID=UPI0013727950|nr:TRAP transporter large permease [Halomonas titanicae]NAO98907.1 TRAP transporter large permease subunit [Halomonas sp. MG34]NVE93056.1 TRAP transporter large permease [Halomonas titanicae]